MLKAIKKGFTIVELVIVIAVIAILAGVLIPSFSSIMKKANLSADKQAVREMNMALAADEAIHGRPANIDTVMKVLANAGYNSDNWSCLTADYEVYWYEKDNRLVLYNAKTAQIEYPENYSVDLMVTAGNQLHIYNENHIKAVETNITLDSNSGESGKSGSIDLISGSTTTETAALDSMKEALGSSTGSNSALKSALGLSSDATAYVYGTRETSSATSTTDNAYATMQIMSVGGTADPTSENLKSNGNLKENVFYIAVNTKEGATSAEVASAQKAAGDFVYTIFTQINTSQLDKDVCIVFPADTVLDLSGKEWSAVKEFEGYFGTDDPEHPLVISGAQLSAATGFSQTVSFTGSGSKYFVTGFFGTIYGSTTIENIVFKDLTLEKPAMDFELAKFQISGKNAKSRNSIGIIGGITDRASQIEANVVLRNIVVEDSVDIICGAGGGGLIGYLGSAENGGNLEGKLLIENCHVSAHVHSDYDYDAAGGAYGPVGGIIGFTCRVNAAFNLEFKDCIFDGTVEGHVDVGAAIGDMQGPINIKFTGTNDFSQATLTGKDPSGRSKVGAIIGVTHSSYALTADSKGLVKGSSKIEFVGTVNYDKTKYAAFYLNGYQYDLTNGTLVKR
ncbi:MAG: type II secretion system protein [Bacilli bacterium]|nr:type II secretion system protein [Bacilli bacterium]